MEPFSVVPGMVENIMNEDEALIPSETYDFGESKLAKRAAQIMRSLKDKSVEEQLIEANFTRSFQ